MTQMATETIIETVVDDLTDHEFEVPCENGPFFADEPTCTHPARWIFYKVPCCGYAATHPSLFCDQCKEKRLMNVIGVTCRGCGHDWLDATDAYTLIEPLKRGS